MGRGDIKTKKGKIFSGSFGKTRPSKPAKKTEVAVETVEKKAAAKKKAWSVKGIRNWDLGIREAIGAKSQFPITNSQLLFKEPTFQSSSFRPAFLNTESCRAAGLAGPAKTL